MAVFGWSGEWNGAIVNFVIALGVSLLFLDLASLINDNSCTRGMEPECPDVFFSQDYFTARQKFREAAKKAGATVESHVVLRENDVEYTMDTAFIKGSSNNLVVHVSGVGGVEGFAGGAVQVRWLDQFTNTTRRNKRKQVANILLVHGVNPHGMATNRRFNENNVILNRNFILDDEEWSEVLSRDPNVAYYEDFNPILNPNYTVPTLWNRYELLVMGMWYAMVYGYSNLRRAFHTGQYHNPDGIMYGGRQLEPSLRVLKGVIEQYRYMERAVVVDVHVGLGRQGTHTLLVRNDDDVEAVRHVWPDEPIDVQARETGISVGFSLIKGDIHYGKMLNETQVVEVGEDLGTLPSLLVGRSIILEHAAHRSCKGTHAHATAALWLRDAVYVQKLPWKTNVLDHGTRTIDLAEAHLERNV